mgnify:CR=1 FL=1
MLRRIRNTGNRATCIQSHGKYKNNNLIEKFYIKNGRKDGWAFKWYSSNKLKSLCYFNNNNYEKSLKIWNETYKFIETINFSNNATVQDIASAYLEAWRTECKGITVYRAGSRNKEVLVSKVDEQPKEKGMDFSQLSMIPAMASSVDNQFKLEALYSDSPSSLNWLGLSSVEESCCDDPFIIEESGCSTCKSCGWSKCHIA